MLGCLVPCVCFWAVFVVGSRVPAIPTRQATEPLLLSPSLPQLLSTAGLVTDISRLLGWASARVRSVVVTRKSTYSNWVSVRHKERSTKACRSSGFDFRLWM